MGTVTVAQRLRRMLLVAALVVPVVGWPSNASASFAAVPVPMEMFSDPAGFVDAPDQMVVGPDGALWFTSRGNDRIGRITTDGVISTFADPADLVDEPRGIVAGPDGALWFTSFGNDRVGRVTTDGVFSSFTTPEMFTPLRITVGPDDAMWFTMGSRRIGRITTGGEIDVWGPAPASGGISQLWGITTGPDGNLWFTSASQVGRITPEGEFLAPITTVAISLAKEIVTGPDGNLWLTHFGGLSSLSVVRVTPAGVVTEFSTAGSGLPSAQGLTVGPDGNLWVTDAQASYVGRVTPAGEITLFWPDPRAAGVVFERSPRGLVVGPDGALWFTASGTDEIGRMVVDAPLEGRVTVEGSSPVVGVGGAWVVGVPVGGGVPVLGRTNGQGRFALFGGEGEYLVEVVDPSGGHVGEWWPDVPLSQMGDAVPVVVGADGAWLDVDLAPGGRTAAVAGRVVEDGSGVGLAGMWVAVVDLGSTQPAGWAVTDSNGGYRIDGLAGGDYLVVFADPAAGHEAEFFDGSGGLTVVSLQAGEEFVADAGLAPVAAPAPAESGLAGTVVEAGSGSGLAGMWVGAVDTTGTFAGGTVTDASGGYELGLGPGNYWVEVVDPTGGHLGEWFDEQPLWELGDAEVVTVTEGATVALDEDLVANPAAPTSSITGMVTREGSGVPVAGAWVAALDAATGGFVGATVAGSDGSYTIDGVVGGIRLVIFVDPSRAPVVEWHHDAQSFPDATPVAVPPGASVTVDAALPTG